MADIIDFGSKNNKPFGNTAQIGIIIQARMTSTRFPGKSLALLNGKPVLQHVIERAKLVRAPAHTKKPIKIIVAVPDAPQSEPMLKLAEELGVLNACGTEHDVLGRYYGAAKFHKLDVVMRITADCPLIDPKVCSEVLELLMWRKVDYASNCHKERTFPKGFDCEVFTYECLEATFALVKDNYNNLFPGREDEELKMVRYDQEHVTPFMIRSPDIKKALVKCISGDFSDENLCVDFPSDIKRLEEHMKKSKLLVPPKPTLLVRTSVH